MKILITATVSSDGYLLPPDAIESRWPFDRKHTLSALRKKADMLLHKNDSLLSLLAEKQKVSDTIYLAEATPQMTELIKGLLLYHLADELIVYSSPADVGKGCAFSVLVDMKEWEMQSEHFLSRRVVCRVYHRKQL